MEVAAEDDILELGVTFLKMIGQNMRAPSKKLHLWRLFNIVCFVIPTFYAILNFKHADGDEYIQTIEGTCILIHVLLKYLVLISFEAGIQELLDARCKFWTFERFGSEAPKATAVFKFVKLVQNIMLIVVTIVIIMFCLRPYLKTNTRFIFACWVYPNSVVLEIIVLACQYYTLGMSDLCSMIRFLWVDVLFQLCEAYGQECMSANDAQNLKTDVQMSMTNSVPEGHRFRMTRLRK
ncbi:hypothetical protein Trydic_g17474 [Trypoxylus dichotomus]